MGIMDIFNKKNENQEEPPVKEQMKQDAADMIGISTEVEGTEKYRQEAKIRHIRDIVKNPLNQMRIDFSKKFLSGNPDDYTEKYVRELYKKLAPMFEESEEKKQIFANHEENFEHFLSTGDIKTPLNLKDEESQFFWGAALGLYAIHPEIQSKWDKRNQAQRISNSTIWRRIASSSYMQQELQRHAMIVENAVDNKDTKLVWSENGYPNISYCFIPSKNMIIDDMLWTLVTGVDAAATAMNHEIAHSKGTQFTQSKRMEEIEKRQNALIEEMKECTNRKDMDGWMKAAKEATRLKLEYTYRFYFFDELENMYANRYAVNFGGDFDRAHLNELESDINVGMKYLEPLSLSEAEKELKADAEKRIAHVKAIARNSFFANNGIIDGLKKEDWHSLHLYPELLSGRDKDGRKMSAGECFECIREICDKFENSQPNKGLKELNATLYKKRMTTMSRRRVDLTDEFFDMFVAPHMEELYQKAEKNLENQIQQMQQQGQQGQPQDGQQGQGQGQQGQGSGQGGGKMGGMPPFPQPPISDGQQTKEQQSKQNQQQQGQQEGSQNQQGQGGGQGQQQNQQGNDQNQQGQGGGQGQQQDKEQGGDQNQQGQGGGQGQQQDKEQGGDQNQQGQGGGQGQQQEGQKSGSQNQQGQGGGQGQQQEGQQGGDQNQQGQGGGKNQQQEGQKAGSQNQQGQAGGQNQQQEGQQAGGQGQEGQDQQGHGNNQRQDQQGQNGEYPDTKQFELPNTDIYQPKMSEERAEELEEKAESIKELVEKAKENGVKVNDLPEHEQNGEYGDAPQKVSANNNSSKGGKNDNDSLENYLPQNDSPTLIDIDDMKKLTPDNMRAARFYREGNWDEYQRYVAQFKNEIAVAKKIIKEIITQNKFDSIKRGKEHQKEKMTQLPVQGGKTIDLQRHVELQKKLRRHDPNITKKDLERFRTKYKYSEEEIIKEVQLPQSNFGILIDGSGSMTGRPFESALAISCILYEAARSFKEINVYIYMMGEPYPLTVATPETKTKEIGKNIESVRDGQGGSCDYLLPAIQQFLKDVSEDMGKHPHVKSGFTHIFSITDGGNDDYFDMRNGESVVNNCLRTMLEKNEQLTFDSFFMGNHASGGGGGYTKPLIHEMQKEGCMRIDYVDGIERGEQIPEKIMEMLRKRLKHSTIKEPMTNSVKEKLIIETLKSMKKR